MERDDDDLWPPFGPGADFREGAGRVNAGRSSAEHRERVEADRRMRQDAAAVRRQAAAERRRLQAERHRPSQDAARAPQPVRQPQPVRRPQQSRGGERQRGGLSRDEIVATAIGIADRAGPEAISMRKIAQVLHAGAMSLYWHLASKEHLLELMLDAMLAEVEVPEPTGDWKADLRTQARSTREVLLRHTWVVDFIGARPPLGPNTLRNLDKMLASLDGLGLDTETAVNALQTVNTYVSGAVIREFQEIRVQREQEQLESGTEQFLDKMMEWKRRLAETGRFDHFLRIIDDNVDPDAESTRKERFEFGLDCVLEGIAVKLAGRDSGS